MQGINKLMILQGRPSQNVYVPVRASPKLTTVTIQTTDNRKLLSGRKFPKLFLGMFSSVKEMKTSLLLFLLDQHLFTTSDRSPNSYLIMRVQIRPHKKGNESFFYFEREKD